MDHGWWVIKEADEMRSVFKALCSKYVLTDDVSNSEIYYTVLAEDSVKMTLEKCCVGIWNMPAGHVAKESKVNNNNTMSVW